MAAKPGKVGENKSDTIRELPIACSDETAAVEFMERKRWGDCPCCPHCGDVNVYQMKARDGGREAHYRWRCRGCGKQFSVRTGTVFEDSRIPLRHWCFAFWAACASKKGVSAKQIQRQTGLSYKSALFLMHRIRFAMKPVGPQPKLTGTVEVDETYVGGKPRGKPWRHGDAVKPRAKYSSKVPVMVLIERGGEARTVVLDRVTPENVDRVLRENVDNTAHLMTDEARAYKQPGKRYASHQSVTHRKGEYSRGNVTTNRAESFFNIFKRGLHGTFHSVSKHHLHRYCDEFAFRFNTRKMEDGERTETAIRAANGKRLLYREPVRRG